MTLRLVVGGLAILSLSWLVWHVRKCYRLRSSPTLVSDWRRFMALPVFINGEERLPHLRPLEPDAAEVLHFSKRA